MRVVIQRVSRASVTVENTVVGQIDAGILLLVGFAQADEESVLKPIAQKVLNLRIFSDKEGRLDLSVLDINGGVLAVPQFTLYADTGKGRRPDFFAAKEPVAAKNLFLRFLDELKRSALTVESGEFGADMQVALLNDGPVTIILDS